MSRCTRKLIGKIFRSNRHGRLTVSVSAGRFRFDMSLWLDQHPQAAYLDEMIRWNTDPALLPEWSDTDLLEAYQRTTGEPGDEEADALLAEIERRGLDV